MAKKQTWLEGLGLPTESYGYFQPDAKKKTVRIHEVTPDGSTKELPDGKGKVTVLAVVRLDVLHAGLWMKGQTWEITSRRALAALNPVLEGPGSTVTVWTQGTGVAKMTFAEKAEGPE